MSHHTGTVSYPREHHETVAGKTFQAQQHSRLDEALALEFPEFSKNFWKRECEAGNVLVAGRKGAPGQSVTPGEVIEILDFRGKPSARNRAVFKEPFRVVRSDSSVVLIEKPRGVPSITLSHDDPETVADFLVSHFPECLSAGEDPREGGLIHRLDTWASGLLLAARNRESWSRLRESLRVGEIEKEYLVLAEGDFSGERKVQLFLQAEGKRVRIAESPKPGYALTETVCRLERVTRDGLRVIRVKAPFAKRHQVRATLAHLGCPLVGDELYGSKSQFPGGGFLLHATRIVFHHPETDERVELESTSEILESL